MTSQGSPSDPDSPSARTAGDTARRIARALITAGVREVVLAPGSRSAPLVYAFAPLADAGLIRTHVRIDERDAAFLALGLARGARTARTRRIAQGGGRAGGLAEAPVAVITTSGSAVANLHPAVLEASYGNLPLLAITADRPARLRGIGANQTIDDQSQVLSDLRARIDVPAVDAPAAPGSSIDLLIARALSATVGPRPGPVQLNVQFDVPLVPTEEELGAWVAEVGATVIPEPIGARPAIVASRVSVDDATVIVAGDAGGYGADAVAALAAEHRIPVLAEPSSALVSAKECVPAHALVLGNHADLRQAIRTVIVHGKPTLSRPVAALLADPAVRITRLPDDVDDSGLEVAHGSDSGASRLEAWQAAGRAELEAATASATGTDAAAAITHGIAARLAASAITLFAASSNTIRYLGTAGDLRAEIHASRGLAGIDGLVSTATGLSLALGERVVLLIGDIAMLHDVGGLLTPELEPEARVDIVVLNDDGGAIFAGLEHSRAHLAPYFRRYFTVPHGRDFAGIASAYGWRYERVTGVDEFVTAFEDESGDGAAEASRRFIEVDLRG